MATSNEHSTLGGRNPVGVFMERPIINEKHQLTRRYPETLMPNTGVDVDGFTITLSTQVTGQPETASLSRWIFQHISDLIEDAVMRFNLGLLRPVANDDVSHDADSTEGATQ